MGQSACSPVCGPADPVEDVVQVNATLLAADSPSGKHQTKPAHDGDAEETAQDDEENRLRLECEHAEEQSRIEREREQNMLEEKIQQERAEDERQAQEKLRLEEEAAKRSEQDRLENLERERLEGVEREKRQEQERLEKEQRETQEKVKGFLKENGFSNVNDKRKKMFSSNYPLHIAVAQNKVDAVQALLRSGADQKQKNSSGQTPQQLAAKCNKKGSHESVLQAFQNSQ